MKIRVEMIMQHEINKFIHLEQLRIATALERIYYYIHS
jgi:hypothetical protein